jgi:poly(A) polymerase
MSKRSQRQQAPDQAKPAAPMPTAREVFDRICWDPRLDPAHFAIGYHERMSADGVREKPLSAWDPNGDIPWHRVAYIKARGERVWDRATRLVALEWCLHADDPTPSTPDHAHSRAHSGAPQAARDSAHGLTPSPTLRWDGKAWAAVTDTPSRAPTPCASPLLTVATLNALHDHLAPHIPLTAARDITRALIPPQVILSVHAEGMT